ncbi:MAG: leucine-rich repeat protein [Oscillospiraceae bacterium]|nr:leucine-rich repeat protein [Oscillospiraceae bacterium]
MIIADGNIALSGAGRLTVVCKRDCIQSGASVTGMDLSLDLTSTGGNGICAFTYITLTNIPTLEISSLYGAIYNSRKIRITAGTVTIDAGGNGLDVYGTGGDDAISVTADTLTIGSGMDVIRAYDAAVSVTVSGTALLKSSYSGTDERYGYGIKADGDVVLGGGGTLTVIGPEQGIRSGSGSVTLGDGSTYYVDVPYGRCAFYAREGISLGSSLVICVPEGGSVSGDTIVDAMRVSASSVAIGLPMTGTLLMENAGGDCRVGDQIRVICSGVPRDAAYVWQTSEDGENWTDMSETAQAAIDSQNTISVTRTAKLSESDRYFRLRGSHPSLIGELYSEPIHVMRVYKVRYFPNGGSGTMDDVGAWLHAGDSYTLLESHFTPPERKGFSAWRINGVEYQPGDVITIAGETSIYAVWEKSEWQIQFAPGNGSGASGTMSPLTVPCEQSFTVPACAFVPPSGKVFSRWGVTGGKYYQPGDVITPSSDMLLVAEWRSDKTVVGFDPNGGSGSMDPVNLTPAQAAAYTVPECTYDPPEDSVFEKWQIVTPGSSETVYAQPGDTVALSGYNVTLRAVWALKPSFEVSFSANGHGTAPLPQSVMQDHYAQDPGALSAEGYTFLGWYTEAAGTHRFDFAHTAITGNITLYAKWMEGVTAISIDGFRFPEAGLSSVRPQLIATGGPYACTGIEWLWPSSSAGSGYAVSYTPICFEISTEYHAIVTLETLGDALFDPNTALQSVTINGDTYGVDLTRSGFVSETKYQLVTLPITTEDLIPIDEAHFPDDAFRAILRGQNYDTNSDGYFSRTEINGLTGLDLSNKGIASLAGIECLSELTTLNVIGNDLSSLDLSRNYELNTVYCNMNAGLTELLLPQTAWLKFLQCYGCALTGLDIRGCTYLILAAEQTPTSAAGHLTYSYLVNGVLTAQLIVDDDLPLYASNVYHARVRFEPGLGTGDMPSVMASKTEYYTLPSNGFTAPEDMYFAGWKDAGTDTVYTAGQTMERYFEADENEVVFIAQWRSQKVLSITVPDATQTQSLGGFTVGYTWNYDSITLTPGKWLVSYDVDAHTGGSNAKELLAGTTYYGTITFPRGVSAQDIIREMNAGTFVLKNATLVDIVSNGTGSSVRTALVFSLQPRTCTVSFMSGGGSGTMAKKTDIYPGSTYTLPNCGFTAPPDKVFSYWSLAWAGSSVHDDVLGLPSITVTVDEDLTLIARWNVSAGAIPVTPDHFPDDDFRAYVSANFDTNHGGYLIRSEIAAATSICIDEGPDIRSLQGIGYLTELDRIVVDSQPGLTSLDLRANTKLTHVEVWDNALTELQLDGLEDLRLLDCSGNQLTELDVSQFELTELYCYNDPLAVLQLGEQPQLRYLHCQGTGDQLRILDIRDCPYLLDAYENGTQTTQSTKVKYDGPLGDTLFVDISTEILTPDCISVDVTHFPDPLFLDLVGRLFDTNHTQWLTPAEIAAARELVIEDTEIASLEGIEYLTALERLTYHDGTLERVDLSRNTALRSIELNGQDCLEFLDISGLRELRTVHLTDTYALISLDLSGSDALEELQVYSSGLDTLTLGQQEHLRILDVYWMDDMEDLDISGCPILMDLLENTSPSIENWVITFTDGENRLRIDQSLDINGYAHPDILSGPANVTAAIEDTAVFTVVAEGARLRLQWQSSADGGETWTDLPGANSETLEIAVAPDMDGRLFRCAATGVYGITVCSRSATLSINGGLCGETAYWKLQDGVLTVYGAGDMYAYTANNEKAPWYDLRTSITSVLIRDGVTSIGNYAFDHCSKIGSVSIGGDVTRIGNGAFRNCASLTTVAVPDSVTEIGFSAFSFCSNLETVTIGSGAASMGSATMGCSFEHCYALKSITVSPANTAFCSEDGVLFKLTDGERAELICYPAAREGESYEIPDTVTSLFRYAFYRSKYLDSVTIPASVTEINTFCFANANDLTEISFLGGAPGTIKSDAFSNVTATVWYPDDGSWTEEDRQNYGGHLTWIPWCGQCGDNVYWTLQDGALRLSGSGAMWNYTGDAPAPWKDSLDRITALYVEEGVTKLGNYAFAGCAVLTFADLPEGLTAIGKNAFCDCALLWEIGIPSTVTSILDSAFMNCGSLTELILPEGLTSMNSYVFKNCSALRSVSIPSTVTRIMGSTFELCSSLTDITIPACVTVIGGGAFDKCSSLTTITFEGSAPQIYDTSFRDVTATAYYPAGDASWTEDMFQDYGGHITWVSYAVYITVTLDPGNGAVDPITLQILLGQPVGELPTPVLEAYGFDGWFTAAGDAVTAGTVFTEDVTLVAHWHRCGDINGDGKVTIADVTLLAKYVKAHGQGVAIAPGAGNVDGSADGKITISDVTLLAKYVKAHGQGVAIH